MPRRPSKPAAAGATEPQQPALAPDALILTSRVNRIRLVEKRRPRRKPRTAPS